ncbi:hypothetical protein MTO96_018685 [Rhipicephalus appendiculatus]
MALLVRKKSMLPMMKEKPVRSPGQTPHVRIGLFNRNKGGSMLRPRGLHYVHLSSLKNTRQFVDRLAVCSLATANCGCVCVAVGDLRGHCALYSVDYLTRD